MITDPATLDETFSVEHYFSDTVYAKRHSLAKGDRVGKHKHPYSHVSIVGYGSVRVTTPESSKVYDSGDAVIIEANIEHEMLALEDSAWFCVHSIKGELKC